MKDLEATTKIVTDWFNSGCVGNLIIFKGPNRNHAEIIIEETRKMREVGPKITAITTDLFAQMGASKLEINSGKDGTPDRIKIVRRIP